MKNEQGYTIGSAKDILREHGIIMAYRGNAMCLVKDSTEVLRPDHPKDCYQILIDHFNIVEPRLKDFK